MERFERGLNKHPRVYSVLSFIAIAIKVVRTILDLDGLRAWFNDKPLFAAMADFYRTWEGTQPMLENIVTILLSLLAAFALFMLFLIFYYSRNSVGFIQRRGKVNRETLTKYLADQFPTHVPPDQPPKTSDYSCRVYKLVEELNATGYSTIGKLHQAMKKGEEAFRQWNHVSVGSGESGGPDQIGIVDISLTIYDCNFYLRRGGKEEKSEANWQNKWGAYHRFIKGGPIPCQ